MKTTDKELLEKLANYREMATNRRAECYVAVRANDDSIKIGYGTMQFQRDNPAPEYRLEYALYWERYDERGNLVEVCWNNTFELGRRAPFEFIQALYPSTGLVAGAAQQVSQSACGSLEGREEAVSNVQLSKANPTPLWWEIERASKAEQRERLIALRREVRALVNYD